MPPRSLDPYRQKRSPQHTPEPFGIAVARAQGAPDAPRLFVIQQHAARRMHWDFRLEIDGVLASWAVPRGPAIDPAEKRLAVQTEDHPLEYAAFEGLIPAGNYGAGAVIVWDRGAYRSVNGVHPSDGVAAGKLDFELQGCKLRGRWTLVRTKGGDGKQWLLISKHRGAPPAAEPVVAEPGSVLSGLSVEELRQQVTRTAALSAAAREAGAAERRLDAAGLRPMLAQTVSEPFSRHGWLFELKYDGWRALAERDAAGATRLFSRNGRDLGHAFPEIAEALGHLPCEAFILDGEIAALDERGATSFERLQQRVGQTDPALLARAPIEHPVVLFAFDLLAVAGFDLRRLALNARKALLQRLVPRLGLVRYADHIETDGTAFFEAVDAQGLEGIVAKRMASAYQTGRRSGDWLKMKTARSADLAVVGYLQGQGTRAALGSLMLAWRRDQGLHYAGNVGSGLDDARIRELLPRLGGARRSTPAFTGAPRTTRGCVFVEPQLIAEVRYNEVTSAGLLRQPVFERLRPDKQVADADAMPAARGRRAVADDVPHPKTAPVGPAAPADALGSRRVRRDAAGTASPTPAMDARPERAPALTNLHKVFWPRDGYTKGDLIAYYQSAWPWMAPYLRDRPVVLTRYPDGIDGKNFYQKNAPDFTPEWVPTCRIEDTDYFICNDVDTLTYVINLGCIPVHVWSARRPAIERPDWTIIDLDPKGAPFAHVVTLARQIHALLEPLAVPHAVKTSGQDGLHILIPLGAALTHDQARAFAEVIARIVASEHPEIATITRPLAERGGKVYVDYLQNGFGKTIAAPYSARPRDGAPVSAPLAWREVNARLDPRRFTIRTLPRRAAQRGDPMWETLQARANVESALAALAKRMAR